MFDSKFFVTLIGMFLAIFAINNYQPKITNIKENFSINHEPQYPDNTASTIGKRNAHQVPNQGQVSPNIHNPKHKNNPKHIPKQRNVHDAVHAASITGQQSEVLDSVVDDDSVVVDDVDDNDEHPEYPPNFGGNFGGDSHSCSSMYPLNNDVNLNGFMGCNIKKHRTNMGTDPIRGDLHIAPCAQISRTAHANKKLVGGYLNSVAGS